MKAEHAARLLGRTAAKMTFNGTAAARAKRKTCATFQDRKFSWGSWKIKVRIYD